MKKLFLALLFVVSAVLPVYAWQIDAYDVDIQVRPDSSFLVTETIRANFTGEAKHGIIRKIPASYHDERNNAIDVSFQIVSIKDETGAAWQYTRTSDWPYLTLKIGSASRTYSAPKTFVITYEVRGALLFLENHDELFWNVTGNEWDAPIVEATATVHMPQAIGRDALMTTAYSGAYGSRESNVKIKVLDDQTIEFQGAGYRPGEGMTIVVGWPKGIVQKPVSTATNRFAGSGQAPAAGPVSAIFLLFSLLLLGSPLLIPLAVFCIMYALWRKYGKDPKLEKSIVVEYAAPDGLKPAEVGTVIDDRVDMRDISASIVDLAVRGYLKIVKTDGGFLQRSGWAFTKLKEYDTNADHELTEYERMILDGIFMGQKIGDTVDLSSLQNRFYTRLAGIHNDIFNRLINKGVYTANPEDIVKRYRTGAIVFFVLTMVFFPLLPLSFGFALSGVIIFAFSRYMPAKTASGMRTCGKIFGFEEFLTRVEKDKIRFEEQQSIFEKMLPYAMCLGIATQWADRFTGLYQTPPEWFSGDYKGGFSTVHLVHDLTMASMVMNSAMASMPRSASGGSVHSGGGFGGGGFSGGGFGGGGGSSW